MESVSKHGKYGIFTRIATNGTTLIDNIFTNAIEKRILHGLFLKK